MFTCPNCNKPGISALHKSLLGPGSQMKCAACGEPVMVRFKPWLLAATPGSLVMIAAYYLVSSHTLMYALSAVGFAMMIGMHLAWVPLEKCKTTTE